MYQSKVIDELLNPVVADVSEEEIIKNRENEIKNLIELLKKIQAFRSISFSMAIILLMGSIILEYLFIPLLFKNQEKNIYFITVAAISVILLYGILVTLSVLCENLLLKNFSDNKEILMKLFRVLTPKIYEITITKDSFFPKRMKVVLEENEYFNNAIIKDKSRHITSYLNLDATVEEKVSFVKTILTKAETDFVPKSSK